MELKTVSKFSCCISGIDFKLLNTEFIVDLNNVLVLENLTHA